MTENPERLIAWRVKRYSLVLTHGPAFAAEAALLGDAPSCPEEVLYIRADIAAAEKAALVAERDALRAVVAERGESDFCRQAVADRVALKAALEAVAGFLGTEWLPWKARTAALDALDALSGKGVG